MECLNGKHTSRIDTVGLTARLAGYREVTIDIGTGDGRYVEHLAKMHRSHFVIGLDACREQLRAISRRAPHNALFVIANAFDLPDELKGRATALTINFPWGSLLLGLLNGDRDLLDGLCRLARPGARLELRLNTGALSAGGIQVNEGGMVVRQVLRSRGFIVGPLLPMDSTALMTCHTTWAKRLAFGREPHAMCIRAQTPFCPRVQGGFEML